jgi:uncharacterized cupin superfamily protein
VADESEGQIGPNEGRVLRIGPTETLIKALTGVDDGLGVLESTPGPGHPAPRDHVHRTYDEVFYVLEGRFEFRLGAQVVRAEAGSTVVVPRGTAHTYKNCGERAGRILIIVSPGAGAQMLEDIARVFAASDGPPDRQKVDEVFAKHDTELVPALGPAEL